MMEPLGTIFNVIIITLTIFPDYRKIRKTAPVFKNKDDCDVRK